MPALHGDGDGEVDVGKQADGGPAVPGFPADDLSGVQAGALLGELMIFFNPPPGHCPGPGAHPVPGVSGNHAGSGSGGHGAARACSDGVVGADRQHIAHLALADAPAQLAAAVHFIAGHEGGPDPGRLHAVQQGAGQLRLGGEHHLLRDAGQIAVLLVSGARLGQVQRPADQRMPAAGGIGQGHRHLAQRDTAYGAAVLAGRADRVARGLLIGRLIHDQHRIPVIEVTDRPARSDVQDLLVVPDRTRQ